MKAHSDKSELINIGSQFRKTAAYPNRLTRLTAITYRSVRHPHPRHTSYHLPTQNVISTTTSIKVNIMKITSFKKLIGIASLMVMPLTSIAAPDPNFHIYLMLGQSNMEGTAEIQSQDQVANPRASSTKPNLLRITGLRHLARSPAHPHSLSPQ